MVHHRNAVLVDKEEGKTLLHEDEDLLPWARLHDQMARHYCGLAIGIEQEVLLIKVVKPELQIISNSLFISLNTKDLFHARQRANEAHIRQHELPQAIFVLGITVEAIARDLNCLFAKKTRSLIRNTRGWRLDLNSLFFRGFPLLFGLFFSFTCSSFCLCCCLCYSSCRSLHLSTGPSTNLNITHSTISRALWTAIA